MAIFVPHMFVQWYLNNVLKALYHVMYALKERFRFSLHHTLLLQRFVFTHMVILRRLQICCQNMQNAPKHLVVTKIPEFCPVKICSR